MSCTVPSATLSPEDTALFFGSFPVSFTALDGSGFATPPASLSFGSTDDIAKGVAFLDLVGDLKIKREAPPNAPIVFDANAADTDVSHLPKPLQQPLVKTADGSVSGIRSGGRSAILIDGPTAYRLKGCGNYVDAPHFRFDFPGFPTRDWVLWGEKLGTELRGCCWEHTALRELKMASHISALVEAEFGAADGDAAAHRAVGPVSNVPVGFWRYEMPAGQPEPTLIRCCALFETLSDKRLGHHLLPGLDLCITALFSHLRESSAAPHSRRLAALHALFPEAHFTNASRAEPAELKSTWSVCCTGVQPLKPIDFYHVAFDESAATLADRASEFGVCERWFTLWAECCRTLEQYLPLNNNNEQQHESDNVGSLLAAVHWRLGRETGLFKRLLRDNHISWGTFCDHDQFEPHCNAHPSNFVVLPITPQRKPGSPLLGTVDFDLAYTRDTFFSTLRDQPLFGHFDVELFDSWMDSEDQELARALAGEAASTGLVGVNVDIDDQYLLACKWAMRDTLLAGFQSGFAKEPEKHAIALHLEPAVEALIKMALMLTSERQS
jgi:hypothetical protein